MSKSNKETILDTLITAKIHIREAIDMLQAIVPDRPPEISLDPFDGITKWTTPEQRVYQHLSDAFSTLSVEQQNLETEPTIDIEAYREMLKKMPKPKQTEVIEFDEEFVGLYKIDELYTLFERPEECYNTAMFTKDPTPPNVMATGQVFKVKGRPMALEIIIVKNDDPRVCWTHYNFLRRITEKDV